MGEVLQKTLAQGKGPGLPVWFILDCFGVWERNSSLKNAAENLLLLGVWFDELDHCLAVSVVFLTTPEEFCSLLYKHMHTSASLSPRYAHSNLPLHPYCLCTGCCDISIKRVWIYHRCSSETVRCRYQYHSNKAYCLCFAWAVLVQWEVTRSCSWIHGALLLVNQAEKTLLTLYIYPSPAVLTHVVLSWCPLISVAKVLWTSVVQSLAKLQYWIHYFPEEYAR